MYNFDPTDHYWRRADGATVYSSSRQAEVSVDDEAYQAWLALGNSATAYPKDEDGQESEPELVAVLAPYGLYVSASTQRITEINTELTALDLSAVRPLRAILAATQAGNEPDTNDINTLAQIETQAQVLRTELAGLTETTE